MCLCEVGVRFYSGKLYFHEKMGGWKTLMLTR